MPIKIIIFKKILRILFFYISKYLESQKKVGFTACVLLIMNIFIGSGEKVEILKVTRGMSLFSSKTFSLFFNIVATLNDFLPRKTSVGKAHLPNWYLLLGFVQRIQPHTFPTPDQAFKMLRGYISAHKTPVFRRFSQF